jgi:histidinol phosphatase-like PHP family hydrolase
LSGHYHAGQPAHRAGGVTFYSAPAACEAPFRFAHLQLRGREARIREHALEMDVPGLVDVHCHTEFAYCGTTVAAEKNVRVAEAMGLAGICLTEHTFHLYFGTDEAWSYRWQTDVARADREWASGRGRMPEYRTFARRLRSPFVRLGLEADLLADGRLLLADEDSEGWDLLVGSVHKIPGMEEESCARGDLESGFMHQTERLLGHPIQVLAHPFRLFRRAKRERPVHLYPAVAGWLAARQVAAEINFHTNEPDPRFVEECLSRGVRIALGTDSHDLAEVGELSPHLRVLRDAGARHEDLPEILYRPA